MAETGEVNAEKTMIFHYILTEFWKTLEGLQVTTYGGFVRTVFPSKQVGSLFLSIEKSEFHLAFASDVIITDFHCSLVEEWTSLGYYFRYLI